MFIVNSILNSLPRDLSLQVRVESSTQKGSHHSVNHQKTEPMGQRLLELNLRFNRKEDPLTATVNPPIHLKTQGVKKQIIKTDHIASCIKDTQEKFQNMIKKIAEYIRHPFTWLLNRSAQQNGETLPPLPPRNPPRTPPELPPRKIKPLDHSEPLKSSNPDLANRPLAIPPQAIVSEQAILSNEPIPPVQRAVKVMNQPATRVSPNAGRPLPVPPLSRLKDSSSQKIEKPAIQKQAPQTEKDDRAALNASIADRLASRRKIYQEDDEEENEEEFFDKVDSPVVIQPSITESQQSIAQPKEAPAKKVNPLKNNPLPKPMVNRGNLLDEIANFNKKQLKKATPTSALVDSVENRIFSDMITRIQPTEKQNPLNEEEMEIINSPGGSAEPSEWND